MSDSVLAEEPSSGMVRMNPMDCLILLQLCTVMSWVPKIPLEIMRDESAGRWFMRGKPGAADYWLRDSDIQILMKTPMWASVAKAKPYGMDDMPPEGCEKIKPLPVTAIEIEMRTKEGFAKVKKLAEKFTHPIDKDDAFDMYVDLARRAREENAAFTVVDDPVEREKQELAKARLEAEAALKKLDEWE